jgi:CBS domain-containing protein
MDTKPPEKGPFHDVGSLFPGEVELVCVKPGTTVGEAIRLMVERRYSQLPVVERGRVRGVFSLWSLVHQLATTPDLSVHDLPVEDIMEQIPVVTVDHSLDIVLEHLERHDAVLVGSPHGPQAIATPTDVLQYFYRIARPFVLLQEIELALRDLMHVCTSESGLKECMNRALAGKYGAINQKVPASLHEMSFEDYRTIITNKENWPLFAEVLGKNRQLVASKLERVREIRNRIFHFREDISVLDHQVLAITRQWLFDKTEGLRQSRRDSRNG